MLSVEQSEAFDRDGFVLIEDLFSPDEIGLMLDSLDNSDRVTGHTGDMPDKEGRTTKIALWNDIGGDVWGAVSASARVVNAAQMLLREEVYHWHSKVMLKEPRIGGAWEWHQDYGYWYNDGCLYPRMISGMLTIDAANRGNGCLKVLVGSHKLGRLNHGGVGNQTGADPVRLKAIEEKLESRYIETRPGTMLWFNCNTLHSSEANESEYPRRAYICCYNALSNIPYGGHGHGKPAPIKIVPDDAFTALARPTPA